MATEVVGRAVRLLRPNKKYFRELSSRTFFQKYESLSNTDRQKFCIDSLQSSHDFEREVLRYLNNNNGGVALAMRLKDDVLEILKKLPNDRTQALSTFNTLLQDWLGAAFCSDNLDLRKISYSESCGTILEKVARGEAVHSVRSLSELKRRLHRGRRCYALFHRSMDSEPLAFIHVAFTHKLAPSLRYLNSVEIETSPTHAMFYSVNSPISSLGGLDLAPRLIKAVSHELLQKHPSIQVLSTLSPIPGFLKWLQRTQSEPSNLERVLKDMPAIYRASLLLLSNAATERGALEWVAGVTGHPAPTWSHSATLSNALREPLMWLCYYYLAVEKQPTRGGSPAQPLDPVARFHLRNGACLQRVTWLGNESSAGLTSSAGMMVNYVYSSNLACASPPQPLGAGNGKGDNRDRGSAQLEFESLPDRANAFANTGIFLIGGQVFNALGIDLTKHHEVVADPSEGDE